MTVNKRIITMVAAGIFFCSGLRAQDEAVSRMKMESSRNTFDDTTYKYNEKGWRKGGLFSLNLAQGSSSNWAAGAEKSSFSVAGYTTLFANKKKGDFFWDNTLDLGYALQKTSSLGTRKTDDKFDFYSKAGKKLNDHWALAGVFNLRTQMTDGYDYDYLNKGIRRRVSGLFAPAYLLVSPGIEWKPNSYFSVLFSPISARWVIVSNDPLSYYYQNGDIPLPDGGKETPLSALYGVNPNRKVSMEAGAYLSASFMKEVLKNVTYKSRLDLFSNYLGKRDPVTDEKNKAKPKNIDVFWTNAVSMKINKFLSVTYNLDLIYDDDVRQFGPDGNSAGTQIRSLLGVGLSAKF
ncbi:DUF3078 domain-containing protein [Flavihumibacter stibioxidans]|nr:DUF3078 domain-containing protein [Flavihumibacter stibioxidans]